MDGYAMDDDELQRLYAWIDEVPLSRQKKNITRDFSDGVLVAEIVYHFIPKYVDIHNYTPANSMTQKLSNWNLLNKKVFSKLNFNVPDDVIQSIAKCKPGVVEFLLNNLRLKIEKAQAKLAVKKQQQQQEQHQQQHQQLQHQRESHMTSYQHQSQLPQTNNYFVAPMPGYTDSHSYVGGTFPDQQYTQYGVPYQSPIQHQMITMPHQFYNDGSNKKGNGHETSSNSSKTISNQRVGHKAGQAHHTQQANKSNITRAQARSNSLNHASSQQQLSPSAIIALEEKTQALLASQETIQILYAKMRRLEHLLHLKDLRIEEMQTRLDNSK